MRKALSLLFILSVMIITVNGQVLSRKTDWKDPYLKEFKAKEKTYEIKLQNDVAIDSVKVFKYSNHKWSPHTTIKNDKVAGESSYKKDVFWNTGLNKVRLRYFVGDSIYTSREQYFECERGPISFNMDRNTNVLTFSDYAEFSIWTSFGGIVMKAQGKEIDLSHLEKGVYYLLIDGKTEKILVR